ncbi:DUF3576 domain-containing protein [Defluviimonas sp. D31]|uniref:DUF3576 domain-containing protein n=1 Tax=Defluviimonas sp. D31 TaxID=3083253 RepID=UPI00296FA83F|nr:DUF3576 domain-containing protein [Defluviimonas sp. D31]MDW4549350.1 DUF3576 domain-containing protein [Defluviimonas sp. D31]
MKIRILVRGAILGGIVSSLAACSSGGLFGPRASATDVATLEARAAADAQRENLARLSPAPERSTVWDLFGNSSDPNTTLEVNKYLWQASLEVLDFLPIQSVDPFSGVIVTGFGTPPGGGRAYRATIYVQDPALDARSLKVALMSKSGPVDTATTQAVEDAILTRARQLRIRDGGL